MVSRFSLVFVICGSSSNVGVKTPCIHSLVLHNSHSPRQDVPGDLFPLLDSHFTLNLLRESEQQQKRPGCVLVHGFHMCS